VIEMAEMLRIPRTRGAVSGVLLILLGVWGGLVPFVGPYFHYAYTPDRAWAYTSGRLWLSIVPALGTLAGGITVLASGFRSIAVFGAFLAGISGAWFAVGSVVGPAWAGAAVTAGTPAGGTVARAAEQIGMFTGLGVAIVLVAMLTLGRLSVVGVRDAKIAAGEQQAPAEPATDAAEEPADSDAAAR
jgi:hypothetical protein